MLKTKILVLPRFGISIFFFFFEKVHKKRGSIFVADHRYSQLVIKFMRQSRAEIHAKPITLFD